MQGASIHRKVHGITSKVIHNGKINRMNPDFWKSDDGRLHQFTNPDSNRELNYLFQKRECLTREKYKNNPIRNLYERILFIILFYTNVCMFIYFLTSES